MIKYAENLPLALVLHLFRAMMLESCTEQEDCWEISRVCTSQYGFVTKQILIPPENSK